MTRRSALTHQSCLSIGGGADCVKPEILPIPEAAQEPERLCLDFGQDLS